MIAFYNSYDLGKMPFSHIRFYFLLCSSTRRHNVLSEIVYTMPQMLKCSFTFTELCVRLG